jgi:hypothetical protein
MPMASSIRFPSSRRRRGWGQGGKTYQLSITIPDDAAPGPASYEVALDYICNPLQNFIGPITSSRPESRS